jgi:putative lipoprotein (rSAM/lipoprotein system)
MRKVALGYFKICNAFIAIVLAFLGFTVSCAKEYGTPSAPYVEYGTPYARFIVKGEVESSETKQPIQNIRVYLLRDSTSTDSTGHYQVINTGELPESQTFPIRFHDVDGTLHGEYTNLDTVVVFNDPQFIRGDGQWYDGETSKDFNVQLKPKK